MKIARLRRGLRDWLVGRRDRLFVLPFLGPTARVIWESGQKFFRDDCLVLAGAVAFNAVLSLIPFALLLLTVAGYFFEYSGLAPEQIFSHLEAGVRSAIPFMEGDLLEQIKRIAASRRAFGLTGLAALLITTGMLFRSLELALGRVFDAPRRRSIWRSQFLLLLLVAALGLLLLLVHFVGVLLINLLAAREVDFSAEVEGFLQQHLLLRFVMNLVVAGGVFGLLVKYFSQQRVRWRALITGGLIFSLLWMLAVRLFGYYLEHLARFSLIYGSLAALAVMVLWTFYAAVILLVCAELSASINRRLAGGHFFRDSSGTSVP
jgi:membrane protein